MKRPIRAALVVPVVVVVVVAGGVAPAAGDPIADKRAEAERIARELDRQGERISVLAEQVNNARLEADRITADATAAGAELARSEQRVRDAQARLKLQAVNAYVRGGRLPVVQVMLSGDESELGLRRQYVDAVLSREQDALTSLRVAREEQRNRRAALEAAQQQANEAVATVEASRGAAAAAEAQQRSTLARVQGELTTLVEAERRRREEAAARRAQEELARRQAQEEAERRRRTATSTTMPKTGEPADDSGDPDGPAPPPAPGADAAVAEAKRQLGKPYEWGAAGPDSFDCSGLTQWAWKAGGRPLPHSSQAQYSATSRVSLDRIQPGDLLFYGSPIHHVGIYAGNGQMIEASETGTPVRYASIFRRDYVGAGRVG